MNVTSYSKVGSFGSIRTIRPSFHHNGAVLRRLEDDYLEDPTEFEEDIDEDEDTDEEEEDEDYKEHSGLLTED